MQGYVNRRLRFPHRSHGALRNSKATPCRHARLCQAIVISQSHRCLQRFGAKMSWQRLSNGHDMCARRESRKRIHHVRENRRDPSEDTDIAVADSICNVGQLFLRTIRRNEDAACKTKSGKHFILCCSPLVWGLPKKVAAVFLTQIFGKAAHRMPQATVIAHHTFGPSSRSRRVNHHANPAGIWRSSGQAPAGSGLFKSFFQKKNWRDPWDGTGHVLRIGEYE